LCACSRESIIVGVTEDDLHLQLPEAVSTELFGGVLAATRPRSAVVFLHGDLGAGKSTLARALLRSLGVTGAIRSPTYTLVERYPLASGGEALHLDLYRIGDAGELEFLALADAEATLWLVEWPDRGRGALPAADVHVWLALEGAGRAARVEAASADGRAWLRTLASDGRLRALIAVN
jgi:tRNA threonylcarbamoyladenosine biosynthesis protein TsaE